MSNNKSLKKYFVGLKISENFRKATKEIVEYLEDNGFVCTKGRTFFLDNYKIKRFDDIEIVAVQIKTGRKIAIILDNMSVRERSIQKLNNFAADYKIVILRNDSVTHKFIEDGQIEVISLKLRDPYLEEYEEKMKIKSLPKVKKKTMKTGDWAQVSGYEGSEKKLLYEFGMQYMTGIYKNYNVIPRFFKLLNAMKEEHKVLFSLVGEESSEDILRRVHHEYRQYYKIMENKIIRGVI